MPFVQKYFKEPYFIWVLISIFQGFVLVWVFFKEKFGNKKINYFSVHLLNV